jgi:anaerobic glycerol-3-phosphate dehydrogenase
MAKLEIMLTAYLAILLGCGGGFAIVGAVSTITKCATPTPFCVDVNS